MTMNKKRFMLIISMFLLSLLLIACSGDDTTNESEESADVESSEQEPAVEETDTDGDAEEDEELEAEESEEESDTTASAAGTIAIYGDTINSHTIEDAVCVVNSRFEQGQRLVFRADVKDLDADESVEDANVKVVIETGEEYEMAYGPHGEEGTMLYTVGYDIPEDAQTGTLNYQIVAEVGGEEYFYEPFDVSLSKLTIVEAQ